MKRSEFFKQFVGLIGVASSIKELSLINTPMYEILPIETRTGDILIDKDAHVYYFDGRFIKRIDGAANRIAKIGNIINSKYIRLASAYREK